jgi:hypothetical protein
LVGMAYRGFIAPVLDGHYTDSKTLIFLGLCAVVIAAHLSLSLGLATLIDKRVFKTKS